MIFIEFVCLVFTNSISPAFDSEIFQKNLLIVLNY